MAQQSTVPLHRLEVPAPHRLPFAMGSFDTIGPLSRAPFPHRHTFHEIVQVTAGRGSHVTDLARAPVAPPQLGFILPGQVHYWERVTGLRGRVVLFEDAFLLAHPEDRALLRRLGGGPWLPLTGDAHSELTPVLDLMEREFQQQAPGRLSVLQSCLHVLVVRAGRLLDRMGTDPAAAVPGGGVGRRAALAEEFGRLLTRSDAPPGRPVRCWAADLGVSVSYLNDAVRSATGRTPARLIREAQLLEAKWLLTGTTLTVRRVAGAAGFADPAYFCRFFRRETGLSPGEFRRDAVRNHHGHGSESIDHPAAPH